MNPILAFLLRVNWKGLWISVTATYATTIGFVLTYFPALPHPVATGVAGLSAFGAVFAFFVETYKVPAPAVPPVPLPVPPSSTGTPVAQAPQPPPTAPTAP
jgi:hypothetical protein